jgi:hypothetical protein
MGKKGGSQTTEVKLPPEIEAAAKANLKVADEVAAIGHIPYTGPTIAGFGPQQMAAMQGTDNAAAAFGLPSVTGGNASRMTADERYRALTGFAAPKVTSNGMTGYSGYGAMKDAIRNMAPAQRAAIESFVMDPVTGAPPVSASIPSPQTQLIVDPKTARNEAERRAIIARNEEIRKAQKAAAASAEAAAARPSAAQIAAGMGVSRLPSRNWYANPAIGRGDK